MQNEQAKYNLMNYLGYTNSDISALEYMDTNITEFADYAMESAACITFNF